MIIYEVNLTINNEIFNEYYHWLIEHVQVMLEFKGFQKAEVAKEKLAEKSSPETTNLTVRYSINNEEDLKNYLIHHAPAMREEGIKKFENKFTAFRRIFIEPKFVKGR